jgi:perosamine synthetase
MKTSKINYIPISRPSITQKEIDYVTDAVKSGWVSSLGKYVEKFEKTFCEYCDTKYALTTANGTVALHLALTALGINQEDEVIVPDFTFVATANAVKYLGAKVITVDIDEETYCISPKAIEKAITSKTKAIVPVHLYGHPANMDEINKIANNNNVFVIEDAAEAHGAEINGKKVGGLGEAGIFSFYGNKIITSGEGGMITTNNHILYEKMKYLRDQAMSSEKRYWHTEIGFNYRMTNLQAALALAQLERINIILDKKIEIFSWYQNQLNNIKGIKLNSKLDNYKNVYWAICIELLDFSETERDSIIAKLNENNIDSRPYFYPISEMPMYSSVYNPVTKLISKRGINLPSYYDITQDQVLYICKELKKLL